jgi:DNA-binding GntR family transcriptional regulator
VSPPLEPLAAPQTLATHTRRAVLAAIADGRLEAGGRYSVAQLAEQLGISRTPVREALLVLEREGRVRFERNRGVRVLETTAADVAEVFELRLLLEVPAAAKACGAVDTGQLRAALDAADGERFHELIVLAAGNRRLAAIVAGLREALAGPGVRGAGATRA